MLKPLFFDIKSKHLGKINRQVERKISYNGIEGSISCLIFCPNNDKVEGNLIGFIEFFARKGLNVTVLKVGVNRKELDSSINIFYFDDNCISFNGKIKNTVLKELMQKEFDILIDLSIENKGFNDFLLKSSRAKCKIGVKREGINHDITFNDIKNSDVYLDKLNNFLTTVNAY